jgi:hypothetical protein
MRSSHLRKTARVNLSFFSTTFSFERKSGYSSAFGYAKLEYDFEDFDSPMEITQTQRRTNQWIRSYGVAIFRPIITRHDSVLSNY